MSHSLPAIPTPSPLPATTPATQQISFGQQGSVATPVYWNMDMNIYPVSEDRLNNISSFSGAAAFCFSFGSLFIQEALKLFAEKSWGCLSDLSVQVTLVLYFLGVVFWVKRGNTIRRMKNNCRPINLTSGNTPQGTP